MCEKFSRIANRVDTLLGKLDLSRKGIVKNDSCVFRAVSERLFNTQFFHKHVKKTCLDYLSRHADEYQPFFQGSIHERIGLLEDGRISAGHLEMIIMSRIYRMDFMLFLPSPFGHFNLTQNGFNRQISLCLMDNDHYDLVYPKTFTHVAAFCQSILYELLYKDVFGLSTEIEDAVIFLQLQKHLTKDTGFAECALSNALSFFGQEKLPVLERIAGRSSPPLPYRVAKALHPTLYRNVELDIVHEEIREERFRKQAYLRRFAPGDKCQVTLNEDEDCSKPYHGHIQELDADGETVVVYIEELTIKKTLPTCCVKPLPIQLPQTGKHSVLPVAEIDVLSFLKKGRRKKTMPIALIPDSNVSTASIPSSQLRCPPASTPQVSNTSHIPNTPELPERSHNLSCENDQQRSSYNNHCRHSSVDSCAYNSNSRSTFADGRGQLIGTDSGAFNADIPPSPGIAHIASNCLALGQRCAYDPSGYPVIAGNLAGPPTLAHCGPVPVEDSCVVPPSFDPYACTYFEDMSQPTPSQGPMYLMPVVAVPYSSNIGQVNVNWTPSHDAYGKDLPFSDINTLRFFFNLGVEYYRMSSCGQQPSTNCGSGLMYIPPAIPEAVVPTSTIPDTANGYSSVPAGIHTDPSVVYAASDTISVQTSISSGETQSKSVYSGKSKTTIGGKGNDKCSKMNEEGRISVLSHKLYEHSNAAGESSQSEQSENKSQKKGKREDDNKEKEKSVEGEDSGSDHMDVGSDGDSGCPSECADLSPINGTDAEFVASDATSNPGEAGSGVTENGKPKGKRRYYMYGNHKLIKPIKEIPLRFQMLLAETSAAKARCEGQPIYMQQSAQVQQPSYDIVYFHTPEGQQPQQTQSLNANASCFIPNQNGDCGTISYLPEENSICPISGFPTGGAGSASFQPAPLFVPPPPPMLNQSPSNSTQPCPTIIMYSGASTASSFPQNLQSSPACTPSSQTVPHAQPLSMPPPFPPPSSVPPPSVETSPVNYPPTVTQLKPAFPVNSATCPSPLSAKTGPPTNPPQGAVMYMVSPAYPSTNFPSPAFQQQGLIMPSVATQ